MPGPQELGHLIEEFGLAPIDPLIKNEPCIPFTGNAPWEKPK
jgi:hypothetical protein